MTEQPNNIGTDNSTFRGSAHLSISNLFSYGLVSAAAMLAFFFAFQGTLLVNYPSIQSKLLLETMAVCTNPAPICAHHIPIGRVVLSTICIAALMFNLWSRKIVVLFATYMRVFLVSGARLEAESGLENGPYDTVLKTHDALGIRGHGSLLTTSFFILISLVWVFWIIEIWVA